MHFRPLTSEKYCLIILSINSYSAAYIYDPFNFINDWSEYVNLKMVWLFAKRYRLFSYSYYNQK